MRREGRRRAWPQTDSGGNLALMLGHLPTPPQPHFPVGISPAIGYLATREPQPLEDREPVPLEWWEEDDFDGEWPARHSPVIKVTAVVVSISLLVAGVGTVLEIILAAH
jgi:hypothetical protein